MLKAPDHQVAGHKARDGKLGPLIDNSGNFFKPLQSGTRGATESSFYTSFYSSAHIHKPIYRFFPIFYGIKLLEASDGSGPHTHLVLEDLMANRIHPCVIDFKIGSRTWYPQASDSYIQGCLKKDRETTSLRLGFRVSGLQIYGCDEESIVWKPEKKTVQGFSVDDVRLVLKRFVSSNRDPNCCFASSVYGGSSGIMSQLLELKAWFENQTVFHFNSTSVLFLYEKDDLVEGKCSRVEVKLIDFAHVRDGEGVIDHNFLGGLCSLIKFISEITQNDS